MILKTMYDLFKKNNIDVYFPSQHKGECIKKYVVIKENGTIPLNVSSERVVYTIMCYVPKENYTQLEQFKQEVKKIMNKLYPTIMYNGNETPSYYDEVVKGHMCSFDYLGCRKIRNFEIN